MTESTGKPQRENTVPPVLVIGAGPAGVVTGYFLKRAGIAYEIIDRAPQVASTWASLYPSLKLNTTRYFSHMPGRKFPRAWGTFPTGKQYHSYVEDFANAHALNISLGVDVTRVAPENGGWRVESSRGVSWHPVVVLATGRFANPYQADLPGLSRFKGQVMHASTFRDPAQLGGQRVMVVGNGPSGLDIAVDVGRHNGKNNPVLLSMRTGVVLRRRYPLGLSKHGWMLLTRWLPEKLRAPFLDYVDKMDYPATMMRGIKTPPAGKSSGAVAYRGPELIHAVRRGEVVCVDSPAEIGAHSVTLMDGAVHDIDALVIATGYRPALGFLDGVALDCDDQGWPRRYNSRDYAIDYAKLSYRGTYAVGTAIDNQFAPTLREVAGYAGLFQIGLYYKGNGAMYNFNVEAQIAAEQIAQFLAGDKISL